VVLGERSAAGGDGTAHARLEEPDHVGVPLADDGLLHADDVGLGGGQPIEDLGLIVDGGRARVQVLGTVGALHFAAPEPDGVALRVEDGEQDPPAEEVLLATLAVDEAEAAVAPVGIGQA
jgi:hypothetical protein